MTRQSQIYQLGPLRLRSAIQLAFSIVAGDTFEADILTAEHLPCPPTTSSDIPFASWTPSGMWIHSQGETRALIQDGSTISLLNRPEDHDHAREQDNGRDSEGRQFVVMLALSALLIQRGMLLLHAAATTSNGTTRIYIGRSGSGKSTAAFFDSLNGATVLADDVVPVYLDADGVARTFQFDPVSALCAQPDPEVAWMLQHIDPSARLRVDGKLLTESSPRDSSTTYRIDELLCLDRDPYEPEHSTAPSILVNILKHLAASTFNQDCHGQQHLQFAATLAKQVRYHPWSGSRKRGENKISCVLPLKPGNLEGKDSQR